MADSVERYEQSSLLLGSSMVLLHTAFSSILTLFLTLVGFKYQGSATTLFKEHSLVISLFMVDIFVYIICFVNVAIRSTSPRSNSTTTSEYSNTGLTFKRIFLISGAIGGELLLFILLTLLRWFVINMFVLMFFEVLRRWHQQINEIFATVTSSMLVPANNFLINHLFQPLYHGFFMLARLCIWGQEVFAVYPFFSRGIRVQQDDQDVDHVHGNGILVCNNVFNNAFYGEDSWLLRIYNRGISFSSVGRSTDHEAGGDVQMIHMV